MIPSIPISADAVERLAIKVGYNSQLRNRRHARRILGSVFQSRLIISRWTSAATLTAPFLRTKRAHQKRHPAFSTRPTRHWLYSNDASDDQFCS
jgi:hypothetical protein